MLAVIIVYRRLQMGAFQSIQLATALAQIARRGREVIDGLDVRNRQQLIDRRPGSRTPGIHGRKRSSGVLLATTRQRWFR